MESPATFEEHKPSQETETELAASNLDPVNYFSRFLDIPEMILQHLNGTNLIKVSEVSPFWYNCTASSKDLMKNIKVVLSRKHRPQEDYNLLKNSSRQYQNIEVRRSYKWQRAHCPLTELNCISNLDFDFFLSKARDWKSVSIIETYFRRKSDLWKFLSSIESSVESLSVSKSIYRGSYPFPFDDEPSPEFKALSFPKLKHLRMNLGNCLSIGEIYAQFLINSAAIEKFEFKCDTPFDYLFLMRIALIKMLENSNKLTNLTLETKLNGTFEDKVWERFQFKLKSLTLIYERYPSQNLKFLESQSNNLEELTISTGGNLVEKEIFKAIMKMPKLKSLEIDYFITKNEIPYEISSSIIQLKVRELKDVVFLKYLLTSMPNVKRISCYVSPRINLLKSKIYQSLIKIDRKFEELKVGSWVDIDRKQLMINENDKGLMRQKF